MDTRFDLSTMGIALATREAAASLGAGFRTASSRLGGGDTLWIDFSHVAAVSPSFADEMAGQVQVLIRARRARCSFGMLGVKPEVWRTLDVVLARRGLQLKHADSFAALQAGKLGLIGSMAAPRVAV